MGIIVNDGWRRPSVVIDELRFADSTPYHSVSAPSRSAANESCIPPWRTCCATCWPSVVEYGTARPLKAAISGPDGAPAQVGGKTGTDSGDSRYEVFAHGRAVRGIACASVALRASPSTSATATSA